MGHLVSLEEARRDAVLAVLEGVGCTVDEFCSIGADPEIAARVYAATLPLGMATDMQIARTIRWYRLFSGLDMPVTPERIIRVMPEREPGFDRLLFVAAGMRPNRGYESLQRQCGPDTLWRSHDDLDAAIVSVRSTDEDYAVWVRDRPEADEENQDRPATGFEQTDCETVEERLIHEGLYFQQHGRHLDEVNVTLCAGSRSRGGSSVPGVGFGAANRRVGVCAGWCSVSDHRPHLRVRSVRRGKKAS